MGNERRRPVAAVNGGITPQLGRGTIEQFRAGLAIDKDDLDECLIRQPELYWHVAEAHSLAKAERDARKLDLEILEAEASQRIRIDHAESGEKGRLTEGDIAEQLLLIPGIQKLRRERLALEAKIEEWLALNESFTQRSYMLRELVPLYLARLGSGSMRSGNPRNQVGERVLEHTGSERRKDYARRHGTGE